jgi:hypothetical protein
MFPAAIDEMGLHFAPLERDRFGDLAFHKYFVPTGRGRQPIKALPSNQG